MPIFARFAVPVLFTLTLVAAAPAPASPPAAPAAAAAPTASTPPDTVDVAAASYSVGLSFAKQWREGGLVPGLAEDAFIRGVRDGLGGKAPTPNDQTQASAFLKGAYQALSERNKAAAQAFLARNTKEKGVTTTASGLQYVVLAPGDPSAPKAGPNDHVTVQYRGTLLDGKEFDSSYAHGKPAVIRPSSTIAGWREALSLMSRGAKWRLYVPPELGYGTTPPPVIPTNSLLVFEIELLAIDSATAPGAPAAAH
jgi:FKBP-type peptidyl-prolyl cis-trans isomerase